MLRIDVGNITSQLVGYIDPIQYAQLRHNLSYEDPTAYMKRRHNHWVSERVHLITEKKMMFRSGLLRTVCETLTALEVDFFVNDKRASGPADHFMGLRVEDDYFRDYQISTIQTAIAEKCGMVRVATGGGKALDVATPILTPTGWKPMEEIKIGDFVVGKNGKPCSVIGIYPQGIKSSYRVTFSDDTFIVTCPEHLWSARTRTEKHRGKPYRVFSTQEIKDRMERGNDEIYIPLVDPIEFQEQSLDLDPYLFGALLGDGCFRKNSVGFSSADQEILNEVRRLLPANTEMVFNAVYDYRFKSIVRPSWKTSNPIMQAIKKYGMEAKPSHLKYIPDCYLFGSQDQRIALLQGLFDTDGSPKKNRPSVEFSTTSPKLASQVVFLVQSLGGTASKKSRITSYTYKDEKKQGKISYRVNASLPIGIQPFRLPRKNLLLKTRSKYEPTRKIVKIEKVESREMKCISVDAKDSLYVAKDCIVTHNTSIISGIVAKLERNAVILVHRIDLLTQVYETLHRLLLYPEIIGKVGNGVYQPNVITVATVQTICAALGINREAGEDDDDENPKGAASHASEIEKMLESAQVVCVDEAHHTPARTISEVLKRCTGATWRIGFSATDWRDDGADLLIEAAIGPRIVDISLSDLVDWGWLVPARVVMFPQAYSEPSYSENYATLYKHYYTNNEVFNQQVTDGNIVWHQAGRHILTLVTAVAHGHILEKMHRNFQIPTIFLSGKDSSSYREEVMRDVRSGQLRHLIGTSIADEGLDLPIIDAINLAGGGKSTIKTYQRIGRALRPFENKKEALVVDYRPVDDKLKKHAGRRANIYRKERAFEFKEIKKL